MESHYFEGLRDGSVGRARTTLPEHLSCILSSHEGGSQPPVMPVPEDLTLSSDLIGITSMLQTYASQTPIQHENKHIPYKKKGFNTKILKKFEHGNPSWVNNGSQKTWVTKYKSQLQAWDKSSYSVTAH